MVTDGPAVGLLMLFSEAESLVHPRGAWKCSFSQLYFAKQALAFKLSMLGHRKIPPYPRAFQSCPLRVSPTQTPICHPHVPSPTTDSRLQLSAHAFQGCQRFSPQFTSLWFRICQETWTSQTQDDVNNCGHCFTSLFLRKTVTAVNMVWQLKWWELPSWKRALWGL